MPHSSKGVPNPHDTQPHLKRPVVEPSAHDTAEFSQDEILQRLEMGKIQFQSVEGGSRLQVSHVNTPNLERRSEDSGPPGEGERRRFHPIEIPTLFPEQGPILLLVVGGLADEMTLRAPAPFWHDDTGGALIWSALARAGLVHRKDAAVMALGQGGFWELDPPRTQGVALTYAGFRKRGNLVDFEAVIRTWNQGRLQSLVDEAWERSMKRLKVVTLGEAARFMMSAVMYGMEGIPILSLPEPDPDHLKTIRPGNESASEYWIEWASDVFAVGHDHGP